MLPPGCDRLSARPIFSGYAEIAITIGIEPVACLAARAAGVPEVTIRSTFAWTSSLARAG